MIALKLIYWETLLLKKLSEAKCPCFLHKARLNLNEPISNFPDFFQPTILVDFSLIWSVNLTILFLLWPRALLSDAGCLKTVITKICVCFYILDFISHHNWMSIYRVKYNKKISNINTASRNEHISKRKYRIHHTCTLFSLFKNVFFLFFFSTFWPDV